MEIGNLGQQLKGQLQMGKTPEVQGLGADFFKPMSGWEVLKKGVLFRG